MNIGCAKKEPDSSSPAPKSPEERAQQVDLALKTYLLYAETKRFLLEHKLLELEFYDMTRRFPSRTCAMIDTLQHIDDFISGTQKAFFIAGAAHLKEIGYMGGEHAEFYSLSSLYTFVQSQGKKIAILLPKSLAPLYSAPAAATPEVDLSSKTSV